jgi:flagellar P-ring protein precursor FlgI
MTLCLSLPKDDRSRKLLKRNKKIETEGNLARFSQGGDQHKVLRRESTKRRQEAIMAYHKMQNRFDQLRQVMLKCGVWLVFVLALIAFAGLVAKKAEAKSTRIKDIVEIEGVRDNPLVGYGLVVGLNGTGDSLNNSPFTRQSLIAMLERLGVNIRGQNMSPENTAAVMVTGDLPAFAAQGSQMDVNVSTLGDADSLRGGRLLATPMIGADGQVYAVAQGPVNVTGFQAQGDAGSVTQNIPTTGRIPEGAIVERETPFTLNDMKNIRLSLRNPDFTTARRVERAINNYVDSEIAQAKNNTNIQLNKPNGYDGTLTDLITDIEQLPVQPDQPARVVVDETAGVVVMGAEVKISRVAIAQGNLTITVEETPQVSQPSPFAEQGQTAIVPRTDIEVEEGEEGNVTTLETGVTLQDLVTGLNRLGVSPRSIITILQAVKAAGALQAEIETL